MFGVLEVFPDGLNDVALGAPAADAEAKEPNEGAFLGAGAGAEFMPGKLNEGLADPLETFVGGFEAVGAGSLA
jgi:hypothetical protein